MYIRYVFIIVAQNGLFVVQNELPFVQIERSPLCALSERNAVPCHKKSRPVEAGRRGGCQLLQQQQRITIARRMIQVQLSSKRWQKQLFILCPNLSKRMFSGGMPHTLLSYAGRRNLVRMPRDQSSKEKTARPSRRTSLAEKSLLFLETKPRILAVEPVVSRRATSPLAICRRQMVTPTVKSQPSL